MTGYCAAFRRHACRCFLGRSDGGRTSVQRTRLHRQDGRRLRLGGRSVTSLRSERELTRRSQLIRVRLRVVRFTVSVTDLMPVLFSNSSLSFRRLAMTYVIVFWKTYNVAVALVYILITTHENIYNTVKLSPLDQALETKCVGCQAGW